MFFSLFAEGMLSHHVILEMLYTQILEICKHDQFAMVTAIHQNYRDNRTGSRCGLQPLPILRREQPGQQGQQARQNKTNKAARDVINRYHRYQTRYAHGYGILVYDKHGVRTESEMKATALVCTYLYCGIQFIVGRDDHIRHGR